jgi:hypothetical protein
MPDPLLPASFLFRYSVPCRYQAAAWGEAGANLGEEFRLPTFASLDGGPDGFDLRAAWSETGLTFTVRVVGKKQLPWCRENRVDESDGLHLWVDTRDTHNIHRAARFCHYFVFLPSGGGNRLADPVAAQMLINRAREQARPVRPGMLGVRSRKLPDGYELEAHISAAALTGFDPAEHPKLGFMSAVVDRELGTQTFAAPAEFAYQEDPSLWATLELVRAKTSPQR